MSMTRNKKKRKMMNLQLEKILFTVLTQFKKEFKILGKYKQRQEFLIYKSLYKKWLTMSKQKDRRKQINKHSKKVYKQQIPISGVKFKKLGNQSLAISKSKVKIKMSLYN